MQRNCLALALLFTTVVHGTTYLSPEYLAASPDGKSLYITAATAGALLHYDIETQEVTAEIALKNSTSPTKGFWRNLLGARKAQAPANPSGLTSASDGALYVVGGAEHGFVQKLTANGTPKIHASIGHTPMVPLLSPDQTHLYVAERFDNQVRVLDADTLRTQATIAVLREPHGLALGAAGRLLFVANHLPYCQATNNVVAASVTLIDTTKHTVLKHIMLPNGSTGVRGMCAAPDGSYIYVTHTFGRYQLPTTQLERGWMNTAGLSILDGTSGDYVNTVLLDDIDLGAANPWGVTVSPDGQHLIVAHAGTHELSLIDRLKLHERLELVARNQKVTEVSKSRNDVPNDLSFLVNLRQRIKLAGNGPHGLLAVGNTIYTALYYSEALAYIPLNGANPQAQIVQLRDISTLEQDQARYGEVLWNDATLCFQHWQSCASCHPDARTDALNWDLLNDGIGNPKQTKNMVYTHLTPPAMVTGIRPDFHACNRKGLTHIQFVVRPESDAQCIDAYSMSLKPVPSPHLVDGQMSAAAQRGEKLFVQAGCATCHPPAASGPNGERLFTNLQKYDLQLGLEPEVGRHFDTPTLIEVWRTAPYLYDGRALTIMDVLTRDNPHNTHGNTQNLSPQELEDLEAYVLSL